MGCKEYLGILFGYVDTVGITESVRDNQIVLRPSLKFTAALVYPIADLIVCKIVNAVQQYLIHTFRHNHVTGGEPFQKFRVNTRNAVSLNEAIPRVLIGNRQKIIVIRRKKCS